MTNETSMSSPLSIEQPCQPEGKVDHLTGERLIKPDCVLDYNFKMGAVDEVDMINSFVECARKTTNVVKTITNKNKK
jgi:hypothetical protein